MATERLIDANAIKYTEYRSGGGRDYPENIVTEYEIAKMPTVDAIPVSWLKEMLSGHPEIPYSVTDGIIRVLTLWEGREK